MTLLRCEPGKTYVDATLGGGGHALEMLRRSAPDGIIIGIDWDEEAICEASRALASYGDRVRIARENFVCLPEVLATLKIGQVDGILLDVGLSSLQLEREERGFSFKGEGPLDMRMDRRMDRTASDLIHDLSQKELEEILFRYGRKDGPGALRRPLYGRGIEAGLRQPKP